MESLFIKRQQVGCNERSELHRYQNMFVVHGAALVAPYGGMSVGGRRGLLPSPLAGEGPGMRGEVSHMFAVHGAALVAPYGGGLFG